MSSTNTKTSQSTRDPANPLPIRKPRQSRTWLAASAAAVVAVLAVGLAVFSPGSTQSAEAQVRAAVANVASAEDFRVNMTSPDPSVPGGVIEGEIDGENMHLQAGSMELYLVDGAEWEVEDGNVTYLGVTEEDYYGPYGEASSAVINAGLQSGDVTDDGTETINGVETTRYTIGIDDAAHAALAALPEQVLNWYTTESDVEVNLDENDNILSESRSGFLEDSDTMTIWIADDLIHQISAGVPGEEFTHTFFDFGADITITPPQ